MPFRTAFALAVCSAVAVLPGEVQAQSPQTFVEQTFAEKRTDDYERAVEAYFDVLAAEPAGLFARQLALVLSDSLAGAVGTRGAGRAFVRWWRSQDPIPSTPLHEGVVEHRLRVASAQGAFAADVPTGFDVRGDVFVRFGAPTRRRVIDVEADLFIARAIRDEPSVRRTDFPANEAWHYPALGPDVYFLFVRTLDGWREGTTMDLLPPVLRAGGISGPLLSRAQLLGTSMRWIYKDLYVFSSDVRGRLVTLDAVVGGDGRAFEGSTGLQIANEVVRADQQDVEAQRRRDEEIPPGRSRILDGQDGGTVWSAARFLDDDGGTTVFVPWLQPAETLVRLAAPVDGVAPRVALLDVTVVTYNEDYRREAVDADVVVVPLDGEPSDPQLLTVQPGLTARALAVEWDQTPGSADREPLVPEPVRATVARVEDLDGLLRPGAAVGLSDVLLFDPAAVRAAGGALDREDGLPVPLAVQAVRPGQELTLYFEVYRPTDEPVEVTTRVDLLQRTEGGLFRRAREVGAGLASTGTLRGRRSPRTFPIGAVPDGDEVRIEVVVTVDATGEEVSRSLTLPVER